MSEQKINFNIDDVNITDIMAQIHENMKARGYDIEEMKKLSDPLHIAKTAVTDNGDTQSAVANANMSANVQYWWQIPAQSGLKGKLRVFTNKVIRKLNYFYMKHVFDQQNIFNMYTANALTGLQQQIDGLKDENAELHKKLDNLTIDNEKLLDNIHDIKFEVMEKSRYYADKAEELERIYAHRQSQIDSTYTALAARIARINKNNVNISAEVSKELSIDMLMPPDTADNHKFDYFLFESKYRGSSQEIKDRQRHYLEYFIGKDNVVDIGCGRGEFLELLTENGISCKGVELLEENITLCREKHLDVQLCDGIEYLRSVPDDSLGGIFCAQVIEHISNEQLIELLMLARKKLMSGAKVILETLNPQCLMIFAESFYMDPSHTKPVHPYVVKFIAECEGFVKTQLIYMTPSDKKMLIDIDPSDKDEFSKNTINTLLFGNREYALVAEK